MTALDDEEWTEAVKQLQEAIRLNPKESTRRIGGRFGLGGNVVPSGSSGWGRRCSSSKIARAP